MKRLIHILILFLFLAQITYAQSKPKRDTSKDKSVIVAKQKKELVQNAQNRNVKRQGTKKETNTPTTSKAPICKSTQKKSAKTNHSTPAHATKKKILDFSPGQPVDLGLPSGTLWADRNLGASSQIEEGGLFIWGDPYGEHFSSVPDGVNEIAGTEYDIVQTKWGNQWCLPTPDQFYELSEKCSIKKTNVSGVDGYLVTGPNGKSLFFPFSSVYKDLFGGWEYQMSWTGHRDSEEKVCCCNLKTGFTYCIKMFEFTIRPVVYKESYTMVGESQDYKKQVPSINTNNNAQLNENNKTLQEIEYQNFYVNGVSFEMAKVKAGTFIMGATPEMENPSDDEKPTFQVTLTNNYYMGKTEVTQALWKAVMDSNPSEFNGDNKPVEQVSWDDCQTFIKKLNQVTGKNFRLPTEAEWEFAARGGNNSRHYQYSGSNTLADVAWYFGNSNNTTHDVATKHSNELGLYDMSGNVWEWCSDCFGNYSSSSQTNPTGSGGSLRMSRGGSWYNNVGRCRSSERSVNYPDSRNYNLGLRLVLSE